MLRLRDEVPAGWYPWPTGRVYAEWELCVVLWQGRRCVVPLLVWEAGRQEWGEA